jgi:hypothetical protein
MPDENSWDTEMPTESWEWNNSQDILSFGHDILGCVQV